MPDSGISDGTVFTSSFFDTYVRQQVIVTCTSATRPTGVEGRMIYETDTDLVYVYDGSAWCRHGGLSAWTSFSPTLTNVTEGNGTKTAFYNRVGRIIHWYVSFTMGSTSSVSGLISVALPVTAARSHKTMGWYFDAGNTEGPITALCTTTVAQLYAITTGGTYAATSATSGTVPMTWTTSDAFEVWGTYEAAAAS